VSNLKKKEIAYKLIKSLNKDDNSLSVTLTGSYSEHFNSNKAGDIDIVIICKKLNQTFFNNCITKIKKLKKKYFNEKDRLIINTNFGPIKYYTKNTVVFHLMIYDLKSHIEHTVKSPFTCYDWERSKIYVGKSLKELCPVFKLQFRDFSETRRSTQEYLSDISKNRITYREYNFKSNKVKLEKKFFKIDKINKRDFIYHIIKFLLINYIKYEKGNNLIINENDIEKKFFEIVRNKSDLIQFIKLRNFKNQKSISSINKPKKLVLNFIGKFDQYIKSKNNVSKIYFSRHKKTKLNNNIFLGQKLNPRIIDKKNKDEFKNIKIDKCYSSPLTRCFETAEITFKKNNIITNNYLKEIDYGDAEGLNLKELNQKYSYVIKMWAKGLDPKFPNGESSSDVFNRLKKFIKKELNLKKIGGNKNVFIFTHNILLRCLIGYHLKIDRKEWFKINVQYFDLLEFRLEKNKLLINIDRNKYLSIFKNFF
jgi:ribonuclease H / adenosylcobalamin/alpha-ribazole phosphatase